LKKYIGVVSVYPYIRIRIRIGAASVIVQLKKNTVEKFEAADIIMISPDIATIGK